MGISCFSLVAKFGLIPNWKWQPFSQINMFIPQLRKTEKKQKKKKKQPKKPFLKSPENESHEKCWKIILGLAKYCNSKIFLRVLFSWNFADAKRQNHSVVYWCK